ncbi:MAG: hypothetical protein GY866_11850 [Proteobacteria bacterium]|nr:hypothetical protein [Pseudomonadota bacterium]
MKKRTPIAFLTDNREAVLSLYRRNENKPGKTWESLREVLPGLERSMSFNTFKQYLSVFAGVAEEFEGLAKARETVIQELYSANAELEKRAKNALERLGEIERSNDGDGTGGVREPNESDNAKRVSGWNVQKAKDGYYRCYRKIGGRVRTIYIGRTLDIPKARRRIKEKEEKLGLYNSCT